VLGERKKADGGIRTNIRWLIFPRTHWALSSNHSLNFPILMAAVGNWRLPLAAGNCVVLKPAEPNNRRPILELVKFIQDLTTPGVLNIVNGLR